MQTCLVRAAVATDATASIAVVRSSITLLCIADHANDPGTLERWLRNKTQASFVQWIADPSNFVVVVELDGMVRGVGMISVTGDVRLCYVEPGFQRRGVGRSLLRALEGQALQWGLVEVRLRSSAAARAFYERHGYASSGPPEQAFGVVTDYPYAKDVACPTSR